MEKNRIEFTGTIERLQSVKTKFGTPMTTMLLRVGKEKFKCVAFNNVADEISQCADGKEINVIGSGGIHDRGVWSSITLA